MTTRLDFCRIYNDATSTEEAAARLGMTENAVRRRAAHYRKIGIRLKVYESARLTPDVVAALNDELARDGEDRQD